MSIIDNTYFINELTLPVDNINMQNYIDEHEPEILIKILGFSLYKDFISGIGEAIPLPKWTDLQNGAEYTDNSGNLQLYQGLKKIIARYVFVQIVADKQNYTTDSGVKIGGADNAEPFNPRYKQVYAHNDMVNRVDVMNDFINITNSDTADTYANYLPEILTKETVFNV